MFSKLFDSMYWTSARKIFFAWAILVLVGFVWTHYYQDPTINWIWTVLSVIGLGVMYKYMPLRVNKLRSIFLVWLGVITFGMIVSFAVFYVSSWQFLISYLGVIWCVLMGLGHWFNGLVDRSRIYVWSGLVQVLGFVCLFSDVLLFYQYIIAGVLGALGMMMLFFYRYR